MLGDLFRVECPPVDTIPNGDLTVADQYKIGSGLWDTEMSDPRTRERSLTHKTVGWQPRPAGFDRQASYAKADPDNAAGHSCRLKREFMRVLAFDRYSGVLTICFGSKLDK